MFYIPHVRNFDFMMLFHNIATFSKNYLRLCSHIVPHSGNDIGTHTEFSLRAPADRSP